MKQIAPNCQDKLWLWAFVILSATIHPLISIHLGLKCFNWEGRGCLSELVIEIKTQCGYFNQHWLLYQGRNEAAHHGAAGHPSPEPQVEMEEWQLHWMWQSLRGANGSPLMLIGIYASHQKQSSYPLWISTGTTSRGCTRLVWRYYHLNFGVVVLTSGCVKDNTQSICTTIYRHIDEDIPHVRSRP